MTLTTGSDARSTTRPIEDRVLGKADIDAQYERLRASVEDPRHGLFGPDSMMWRMVQPLPVIPFMLVQAGLLEGAAPKIWFGTERSVTRSGDYTSRFARSYDAFADWFLGDIDTALRRGRKIHGYHSRVGGVAPHSIGHVEAGQEYRATEQQLMLFTVGTQIVPIKQGYELLSGALSADECDRYWDDCKRFCLVFGIDPEVVPATWSEFERYWDGCLRSGELEAPSEGFTRYGPLVDASDMPWRTRLLVNVMMSMQFNLMPDHLRSQFARALPIAAARPGRTAVTCFAFRWLVRLLPSALTVAPRARAANRRVGGESPAGPLARWLARQLPHPYGDALPSLTTPASVDADPERSAAFQLPAV